MMDAQHEAKAAFDHLRKHVLPEREELVEKEAEKNAASKLANPKFKPVLTHASFIETWWQQWRRRSDLIHAIGKIDRYIGTSRHASEKRLTVFTFIDSSIRPADSMSLCTLDDDYSFGILSSSVHRAWFEARCSRLETRLRYTSTTVFDSFPWPQGPTQKDVKGIAETVAEILDLRAGNLDKGVPLADQYDVLRQPGKSKLRDLHTTLDRLVVRAYGFSEEDDLLTQLLALNQDIANDPSVARGPGAVGLEGARVSIYRLTPTG